MIDVSSSKSAGEGTEGLTGGQIMACPSCSVFYLLTLTSLEVLNGKREIVSTTGIVSGRKLPKILVADLLSSGNG